MCQREDPPLCNPCVGVDGREVATEGCSAQVRMVTSSGLLARRGPPLEDPVRIGPSRASTLPLLRIVYILRLGHGYGVGGIWSLTEPPRGRPLIAEELVEVRSSVTGPMRSPQPVTVRGPHDVTMVTLATTSAGPLLQCVLWERRCMS